MNDTNPNASTMYGKDQSVSVRPGVLGAHPIGTGLGAVGTGAAAGAVGGAFAGPVGAVVGAAVGAVVGGIAGRAAAEAINPGLETEYWRQNYATRPYADAKLGYDAYGPAYRYGWESFARHGTDGKSFESVETGLGRGWDAAKNASRLAWEQAKPATREAWDRVEFAARGSGTPAAR